MTATQLAHALAQAGLLIVGLVTLAAIAIVVYGPWDRAGDQ